MKHILSLPLSSLLLLALFSCGSSSEAQKPAQQQSAAHQEPGTSSQSSLKQLPAPLWVDLQDVADYTPSALPDSALIEASMRNTPALFSPDGATLKGGMELQSYPLLDADEKGTTYQHVSALMESTSGDLFFRFFILHVIDLGGPSTQRALVEVTRERDLPLSSAHFAINAGLIQRMVILSDTQNEIQIIYPLGVGGVDPGVIHPGVTSMLTPLFSGAVLKRSTVTRARQTPTYYRGLPFMPITNRSGLTTPIAFHISVLSDEDWANKGGNYLVRGLESHGCMRLREKDLTEFFDIVMNGGDSELPVNVSLFAFNAGTDQIPTELHPYPLTTNGYERVKNVAAPGEAPMAERDPVEHLIVLEDAPGQPDFTKIAGFSADETTDLKQFEGLVEPLPKKH